MERGQRRVAEIGVIAVVDHVLKDDHAEAVAVVVKLLRLDLDVLAQGVEAQGLHGQDVLLVGLRHGGGVEPVAPVALIQYAVEEIRLSVEAEARDAVEALDGERAQRKIGVHPVLAALQRELVQPRGLRAPELCVGHRDADAAVNEREALPLQQDAALVDALGLDLRPVGTGADLQSADMALRHRLQPHRLPDARAGRIPHAAALPALLPPGIAGIQIVDRRDAQLVLPLAQGLGHIDAEGQIGVVMSAELPAVERDDGETADRAEVQQHPPPAPARGHGERAATDDLFADLRRLVQAAQQALGAEGDADLPRTAAEAAVPPAVEAEPVGPAQLRARIALPGDRGQGAALLGIQFSHAPRLPRRFFCHYSASFPVRQNNRRKRKTR